MNGTDWEVISSYSRAQAIEDGELVDLKDATNSQGESILKEAGMRYPVAMTRGAWAETIEASGHYEKWPDGYRSADGTNETLILPGGQDVSGRLWDVLHMLKCAIKTNKNTDRVHFQVLVWRPPEEGEDCDGHHDEVRLWCLVGPGDTADPVMTIMLEGED